MVLLWWLLVLVFGATTPCQADRAPLTLLQQHLQDSVTLMFLQPDTTIEVQYGNHVVAAGELLPRAATAFAPDISIKTSDSQSRFTVLMVDPDAPDPDNPTNAEVRARAAHTSDAICIIRTENTWCSQRAAREHVYVRDATARERCCVQ
jgi:hypothetical protein